MSSARERILDAYEACLIEHGTTTLDSVAARAEVSKGGLIYHFASKEALGDALVERLLVLGHEDVAAMRGSAETAIGHFIHSASDPATPLGLAAMAAHSLARNGHAGAARALSVLDRDWREALVAEIGDEVVARIAQLVGDGIYYNAALSTPDPEVPASDAAEAAGAGDPAIPDRDERSRIVTALLSMIRE